MLPTVDTAGTTRQPPATSPDHHWPTVGVVPISTSIRTVDPAKAKSGVWIGRVIVETKLGRSRNTRQAFTASLPHANVTSCAPTGFAVEHAVQPRPIGLFTVISSCWANAALVAQSSAIQLERTIFFIEASSLICHRILWQPAPIPSALRYPDSRSSLVGRVPVPHLSDGGRIEQGRRFGNRRPW